MLKHGSKLRIYRWLLLKGLLFIICNLILAQGFDCDFMRFEWCAQSRGSCSWSAESSDSGTFFLQVDHYSPEYGYALLSHNMYIGRKSQKYCLNFSNHIIYRKGYTRLSISVYDSSTQTLHKSENYSTASGKETFCYSRYDVDMEKVTLNASCVNLLHGGYLTLSPMSSTMFPSPSVLPSSMPTNENPTPIGDIQYVGVVVGAICIALFTLFSCLTIISARRSSTRESRRREVHNTCNEEDDRPDVVADNAPPSYDAVMACPEMYPTTPQGSPAGTPDTTPHLSLHRRVILNQLGNSSPNSQRNSVEPVVMEAWDEEQDPPPPYPGLTRTSGTGEDTTRSGEDTTHASNESLGANNTGGRTEEIEPPINDSNHSSPPTNGPWVLNNTRNIHPRVNTVRNLRHSESEERNSQQLVVQPRADLASPGSEQRNGDINGSDIELNNSRNRRRDIPKTENSAVGTIPQLTVV